MSEGINIAIFRVIIGMRTGVEIYSVKRLSDNKIFTVGDEVRLNTRGKIKSFLSYKTKGIIKIKAKIMSSAHYDTVNVEEL